VEEVCGICFVWFDYAHHDKTNSAFYYLHHPLAGLFVWQLGLVHFGFGTDPKPLCPVIFKGLPQ